MKKFRGKKRYFRNLKSKTTIEHYNLDFGNEGWFNFWHTHLDYYGLGNKSLKIRREHIKAQIALYVSILEKLKGFEKPYQSWIEVVEEDAGLDAVYLNTPNPYDDNFPLRVEGIDWNCKIPSYLGELINLNEFNVGHLQWESKNYYIIQSIEKGIEL